MECNHFVMFNIRKIIWFYDLHARNHIQFQFVLKFTKTKPHLKKQAYIIHKPMA